MSHLALCNDRVLLRVGNNISMRVSSIMNFKASFSYRQLRL